MSQPLPHPDTTLTSCDSNVREAYSRVYDAQDFSQTPNDKIYPRIVGYLLIYVDQFKHTLGEQPITYLAEQIHRTLDERAVFELGKRYLQLFGACARLFLV
jgi:hypothetical protein